MQSQVKDSGTGVQGSMEGRGTRWKGPGTLEKSYLPMRNTFLDSESYTSSMLGPLQSSLRYRN